jgi:hypothetical protein
MIIIKLLFSFIFLLQISEISAVGRSANELKKLVIQLTSTLNKYKDRKKSFLRDISEIDNGQINNVFGSQRFSRSEECREIIKDLQNIIEQHQEINDGKKKK